jgi:hypothetical protein
MARTGSTKEGRRQRAADTRTTAAAAALVAKALRLLARNADRMHFSEGRGEWERLGVRNGRIWRAISRLGIEDEVLAGLRDRHGKLPPAVRNWRKARPSPPAVS